MPASAAEDVSNKVEEGNAGVSNVSLTADSIPGTYKLGFGLSGVFMKGCRSREPVTSAHLSAEGLWWYLELVLQRHWMCVDMVVDVVSSTYTCVLQHLSVHPII